MWRSILPDHAAVIDFCRRHAVDLVVVGPETPLAAGIVDDLAGAGIKAFGPSKQAAQLEGSKGFTKALCSEFGIPTGAYGRFETLRYELCARQCGDGSPWDQRRTYGQSDCPYGTCSHHRDSGRDAAEGESFRRRRRRVDIDAAGPLALRSSRHAKAEKPADGYEDWKQQEIQAGFSEVEAGESAPNEKAIEWLRSWGSKNELPPPV